MALVDELPEWAGTFPFVDGYVEVVEGKVSLDYVRAMRDVLRAVIDANVAVQADRGWTAFVLRTTVVCVAALQRCELVLQCQEMLEEVTDDDVPLLAEYMDELWDAVVQRDAMCLASVDLRVVNALEDVVSGVWRYYVSASIRTLQELAVKFDPMVSRLRFLETSGVWVESSKGVLLADIPERARLKPVLAMASYRTLIQVVKDIGVGTVFSDTGALCAKSLVRFDGMRDTGFDMGFGFVPVAVLVDWLWLLEAYSSLPDGACYLGLFHPASRRGAFAECGLFPTVAQLRGLDQGQGFRWTDVNAVVTQFDVVHVEFDGYVDLSLFDSSLVVGGDRDDDYYARALVDEFILRYKPVDTCIQPVDKQLMPLTLDTSPAGIRRFSGVADLLYESVGKALSPGTRARGGPGMDSVVLASDHSLDLDENRLVDLRARLVDGPAIEEAYYDSTFRRRLGSRWRPRPRLRESGGRALHVFEGFPASSGTGIGSWVLDDAWDVPGWTSYVAKFRAGTSETFSFTSPVEAQDIRMDCTGDGTLDFGDCKVMTRFTVLWFGNSVKFKLKAESSVSLRISVPSSGQASAIGITLRRYLRISGYVIAMRHFDVLDRPTYIPFAMERIKKTVGVGCRIYTGKHQFERGRHRVRLADVSSTAPMKLLVVTEPPGALSYVEWYGIRVYLSPMNYVGLLIDNMKTVLDVVLSDAAAVVMSIVQIVDVADYEVAIKAIMAC